MSEPKTEEWLDQLGRSSNPPKTADELSRRSIEYAMRRQPRRTYPSELLHPTALVFCVLGLLTGAVVMTLIGGALIVLGILLDD